MRYLPVLLIVALAGVATYSFVAVRRHADGAERARQRAAEAEAAVRHATAMRDDFGAELARTQANLGTAVQKVQRLEAELHAELGRREDIDDLIETTTASLREERERHNREIWEAKQFMPEGVRQALIALNECLRLDGHDGLRFLKASKIEDKVLSRVQMLDRDPSSLTSTIYLADEMTFDVDRVQGTLTLCCKGGYARGPNGREELPALGGKRIVLPSVDTKRLEDRLPYLVRGHGMYTSPAAKRRVPVMDPALRAMWKKRINELLAGANTAVRYKLDTFRNVENAAFIEALLVGYDAKNHLAMSVEAQRIWVFVDDRGDAVELWMQDGVLRKRGLESALPSSGFRIRLSGVKPGQALDRMLGMVKRQ